jgi:hypothetical protein
MIGDVSVLVLGDNRYGVEPPSGNEVVEAFEATRELAGLV